MKLPLREFFFAATSLLTGGGLRATTLPAADALVQIEGRTVATSQQGVRLSFPGVAFHLAVRGTSLSCRANTTAEEVDFDVVVDGSLVERIRLPRGESDTLLFQGKTDAEHRVELVHCTESSNGVSEIESFTTPGDFLPPPPAPQHKLLFLGDSFTAGAATECRPGLPVPTTKAKRQNARLSYGWLLSRRLQAQVSIVAYAGRGLLRDWQGVKTVLSAPEFYENAVADEPGTAWNHHDYQPDVIGICLGNDFDAGVPDETDYIRAYVEFIRKLRRDAPRAAIILILSPVVNDPKEGVPRRTVLHAYLDEIARRSGGGRIEVVDVGTYPGVPGDWHPDGTAHEAVANLLEPIFRRALD